MALNVTVRPRVTVVDGVTPLNATTLNDLALPYVEVTGTVGGATSVGVDGVTIDQAGTGSTIRVIPGAIGATQIDTGAVTETKIGALAVTFAKLGPDAFVDPSGLAQGLIVKNNVATPNTKVDVDADLLFVPVTGATNGYWLSAVSLTADIAADGANGLDTGAINEAINTWYYVWVLYNPTATTAASLLSVSSTAPVLPSGDYTCKTLVGAVRNQADGHFRGFWQSDRAVWAVDQTVFTNGAANTNPTDVNISSYVPPTARVASGSMGATSRYSGVMLVAGDGSGLGGIAGGGQANPTTTHAAIDGFYIGTAYRVPMPTAQTINWAGSGLVGLRTHGLTVSGWEY